MKLLNILSGASLGVLALSLGGCIAEPTYSKVPEISLNSVKLADAGNNYKTLDLTINYQDGDGDLGLTKEEYTAAPYLGTRFEQNFFIEPYVKVNGVFVRLTDAGRPGIQGTYNQTFVHASSAADNRSIPIKGTLTWSDKFFVIPSTNFPRTGDAVEFHVSIADRAMHESNTIIVPVQF